jgi:hypothetical protein
MGLFLDPLATYHGYHGDWNSRSPLGFPFRALWLSAVEPRRPLTNLILNSGWIIFAVVGFAMLWARAKNVPRERRVEWLFAILYLLFLFPYNSTYWAFAEFPRFLIPVIPIVLAVLWLPRKRVIWIPLALASAVLAARSAIGIHNVLPI